MILYGIKRTENRNMLPDPILCRGDVWMWTLDADLLACVSEVRAEVRYVGNGNAAR